MVSEKYIGFVIQRTNAILVLSFYSFFGTHPWKEPTRCPAAVTLNNINILHFSFLIHKMRTQLLLSIVYKN